MSATIASLDGHSPFEGMKSHPNWSQNIAGLEAEKLIKRKIRPHLVVMHLGEASQVEKTSHYFVPFVMKDFEIKHRFLVITKDHDRWCYEYEKHAEPYKNATIDPVIRLMMPCEEGKPKAFVK